TTELEDRVLDCDFGGSGDADGGSALMNVVERAADDVPLLQAITDSANGVDVTVALSDRPELAVEGRDGNVLAGGIVDGVVCQALAQELAVCHQDGALRLDRCEARLRPEGAGGDLRVDLGVREHPVLEAHVEEAVDRPGVQRRSTAAVVQPPVAGCRGAGADPGGLEPAVRGREA